MAINIVLGSEQAVSNWGEDAIYKLQDSARQKLMRYKMCQNSISDDYFNYFELQVKAVY